MNVKEKKQTILTAIAIMLALVTSIVPAYAVESEEEQSASSDFTFTVLDDKSVEVASYTGNATEVVIPDEAYGREVTSIGNAVFQSKENLVNVKIPDSVTKIGRDAFWNTGLKEIELPNSVEEIGDYSFGYCINLEKVYLPEGVIKIGNRAFSNCPKLLSITIPSSVTNIDSNAFGYTTPDFTESSAITMVDERDAPKVEGFKIYCYKGTAGEDYVINNGFDYEYLEAEPTEAKTEPSSESEPAIEATTGSSAVQTIAQPSDVNPVQSDNTPYIIVIAVESIIILALLAVIIMMAIKKKKSI